MNAMSPLDGFTCQLSVTRADGHEGLWFSRMVTRTATGAWARPLNEHGQPVQIAMAMDLQDALYATDLARAGLPDRSGAVLFDPATALDTFSAEDQRKLALAALVMCVAHRDEMPKSDVAAIEAARIMDNVVMDHLGDVIPPRLIDLAPLGLRMCHACGCTEACGCAEGCSWSGPNQCSACHEEQLQPVREAFASSRVQITDRQGNPVPGLSTMVLRTDQVDGYARMEVRAGAGCP